MTKDLEKNPALQGYRMLSVGWAGQTHCELASMFSSLYGALTDPSVHYFLCSLLCVMGIQVQNTKKIKLLAALIGSSIAGRTRGGLLQGLESLMFMLLKNIN
ncbi:hypothetical protein IHE45_08G080500 [Dioscorea alata]|uniref:Uncharacterized protein n=1 Tax=Dioscorea alata TaxID=55571 RepID=A0ACB7VJU0_DIOAL|nr:hypothetical protein IHE45_08G080500 [Dioscorea alata]